MDPKLLNTRKKEILDAQEVMLKAAVENKSQLSAADETTFTNLSNELDALNANLARIEALNKGKLEIAAPREQAAITNTSTTAKFFAVGGYRKPTKLSITADYVKDFWASLRTKADHERFVIQNAALGEGGSAAAGGVLVPVSTDPSITPMAMEETVVRSLSRVITTTNNLYLNSQAALTGASIKPESNSSGTNAFGSSSPTFSTTLLGAYNVGNSVTASWELLQDSKAAADFIPFDLQRGVVSKEENLFINGTGSNQPQGYLGNASTANGASITSGAATLGIDPILDLVASLKSAYYRGAKFLVNRQEFNRLLKAQIAANMYQTFVTFDPDGTARLLGYPVAFSAEMPVYSASPSTTGAWLFGDFSAFAVIGDRGDSNLRVKILDQPAALDGQTIILGYRRTDQRIVLGEAVYQLNTNG